MSFDEQQDTTQLTKFHKKSVDGVTATFISIVVMVICCVTKMRASCSSMIAQFF